MCGAFGDHIRQSPNAPLVVKKRLCHTHSTKLLVQWCRNNGEYSARYFCQRKAEEGGDAGASLTDDNAAMAEIAGAVFTVISAMLY